MDAFELANLFEFEKGPKSKIFVSTFIYVFFILHLCMYPVLPICTTILRTKNFKDTTEHMEIRIINWIN